MISHIHCTPNVNPKELKAVKSLFDYADIQYDECTDNQPLTASKGKSHLLIVIEDKIATSFQELFKYLDLSGLWQM